MAGNALSKSDKKYMAHQEQTDLDTVMGHNMEDLLGLGDVFKMMGYLALRDGAFNCSRN